MKMAIRSGLGPSQARAMSASKAFSNRASVHESVILGCPCQRSHFLRPQSYYAPAESAGRVLRGVWQLLQL